MATITFTDKDKTASNGIVNKWRDVDANEVKSVVNTNAQSFEDHTNNTNNPHTVTASQTGALSKLIETNRQAASYTLVLGDAEKLVEMNAAAANNLTVPPNADVAFPVGTQILVAQYGAGQTSFVAGAGVTIRSEGSKLKMAAQYAAATLVKIADDEWYLFGSLTA